MQKFFFLLLCALTLSACFEANYKIEELYGTWNSEELGFTFNEDGSCEVIIKGNKWPGETKFRPVSIGNTLEFTADGKVFLSNVTIKGLEGDVLQVEMRNMLGSNIQTSETHTLHRVK